MTTAGTRPAPGSGCNAEVRDGGGDAMTGAARWRRLLRYVASGLRLLGVAHPMIPAWPEPECRPDGPARTPATPAGSRRPARFGRPARLGRPARSGRPVLPGHPERAAGGIPPSEVELLLWRDLGWLDDRSR
ncbi:hypothetical protein [Plantactinospora sp. KBS50]|uniref:hypothetical protein n=1 Tax=Plantactinospora sp. KBS50 TaxID=2024580 RepID=UPI000BAB0D21|nr:hypothetical protein [Plantactinospora sp. KBS50]ASW54605.1 hypothetical protein CIK06_11070 [Plantactinospora sp. KBS50]